jgi:hypothetical protein
VNKQIQISKMLEWEQVGRAVVLTDGFKSGRDSASVDGHVKLVEFNLESSFPEVERAIQRLRRITSER